MVVVVVVVVVVMVMVVVAVVVVVVIATMVTWSRSSKESFSDKMRYAAPTSGRASGARRGGVRWHLRRHRPTALKIAQYTNDASCAAHMRRAHRRAPRAHLLRTRQLDELLELGDATGRGGGGGGGGHGGVDGDGVGEKLQVPDHNTCYIFPREKRSPMAQSSSVCVSDWMGLGFLLKKRDVDARQHVGQQQRGGGVRGHGGYSAQRAKVSAERLRNRH